MQTLVVVLEMPDPQKGGPAKAAVCPQVKDVGNQSQNKQNQTTAEDHLCCLITNIQLFT